MDRRACLAIGVSTVVPVDNLALNFAYLDGAVFAARSLGEWALSAGFGASNVRVVDDEPVDATPNPVTRERVQKAVDELFPPGAAVVDQLILAYCGHGLTDANFDSVSWLFSDSLRQKYRVVANAFYAELLLHGVRRITLISDACREAPQGLDLMRLDGVRGIVVQGTQVDSPKFDRLTSCQDGQLGYMVFDPAAAAPGKCVFSGVITDALWGLEPTAIEKGVITTTTLGKCVRSRTTERASQYHLRLNPQCQVDVESAVLYDTAEPLQVPGDLQPWPAGTNAAALGASPAAEAPQSADHILERVHTDPAFRDQVLGADFGLKRFNLTVPDSQAMTIPDDSKDLLRDLVELRQPATWVLGKKQQVRALVERIETEAAAGELRQRLGQIGDPGGANLYAWGNRVKLWYAHPIESQAAAAPFNSFRIDGDDRGLPVLVEVTPGQFSPVVPYQGLFAVIAPNAEGDIFQAYGEQGFAERYQEALKAIDDFAAGRLRPDSLDRLAADLRRDKHADPMLGVICAYLYRATADFDNIRRMACFYAKRGQAVPYDIALLGAMPVTKAADGALIVQVPAVKARQSPDGGPALPNYAAQATDAVTARIGGRCPWLGLGWDYVQDPRPEWAALVEGLAEHAAEVRRSGSTLLPKASADKLAQTWGLTPR
ncbi:MULTISPECIES: caspase family protein [unclassified Pseudomonas]|uniref:caspase family protein n=1 Tax=unclassified Pseudomonas TaxID=196821 RepID=UPI000A1E5C7C|nr:MULTISPECIES: caspase family protein [unclassified Pseudomonas]